MTSAGQILPVRPPPYFIVIDRALRDEGTSYHYLPPSDFSHADPNWPSLRERHSRAAGSPCRSAPPGRPMLPFGRRRKRSTQHRSAGILAVEMEAAALYAFARRAAGRSFALRMSPTRWAGSRATSRRARPTAPRSPLKVISLAAQARVP